VKCCRPQPTERERGREAAVTALSSHRSLLVVPAHTTLKAAILHSLARGASNARDAQTLDPAAPIES
jgi:hypothetical protein